MKTMTFRETNITHRALLVLLLVMAFSVLFIISAKPTYAEETYTVTGEYTVNNPYTDVTSLPADLKATTFEIYKVGTFKGSDLELIDPFASSGADVNINKEDFDNEEEWTRAWMDSAQTLSNYTDGAEPVRTETSDAGGHLSVDLPNGLYLFVGDSQKVNNYPESGDTSYFWPLPQLVLVWNGDTEVGFKPAYECLNKLRVVKKWEGDSKDADKVRPSEIRVKLLYDGEEKEIITLSEENNWTYEWEVGKSEKDPSKWSVQELSEGSDADKEKLANYKVSISESFIKVDSSDDTMVKSITNTYNPKPTPPPTDTDKPGKTPKTGDTFPLMKVVLVMVAALAVAAIALVGRRRKDSKQ